MSSQSAQPGPTPAVSPPTLSELQSAFEASIWYTLNLWPALHTAVQNNWGGPASIDKRDWFAGAIGDLFTQNPSTDFEDLIVVLLDVMWEEFEVNVEDDSEEQVAREIMVLKKKIIEQQDLTALKEVEERWRNRGKMKVDITVVDQDGEEVDEDDSDWEGFNEEDDVEMEDGGVSVKNLVPTAAPKKEKAAPEIDDDGFTKVVSKKR